MKIILTVVVVLIILVSCRQKMENKRLALLKGDWQLNEADDAKGSWGNIFSFEDSICSLNRSYSYTKFKIDENTLIIRPEGKPIFPNSEIKSFSILSITNDLLLLKTLLGSEKTGDTILLKKIQKKNSLIPEEIYFSSTNCNGYCPVMKLKIDHEGSYHFWGSDYCKIQGLYSGVLDKSKYQILINKIQNLPIDSILPRYDVNQRHYPKYGMLIKTKQKQFISCLYGSDEAPDELYILFNFLMDLHNYFDTKKDTLLTENYFETKPEFQKIKNEFRYLGHGPDKDAIKEWELSQKEYMQSLKHLKGIKYKEALDMYKLNEQMIENLKLYLQNDST